jgi:hypothetical protein
MPDSAASATSHGGGSFREVVATWRLRLHTEVKKASALPTAMFDACDPMLETRLAETAETLLAQLEEPDPVLADDTAPGGDRRLELVSVDELRRLPRAIAAMPSRAPGLDDDLAAEQLGVLADTCCAGDPAMQQRAVARLCRDFGVDGDTDLQALAQLLDEQARTAIDGDGSEDDLAATCRRIAATVTLHGCLQPKDGGSP